MSLVDDLAGAIARFEGFFRTASVAQRNNNPGNLRSWGDLPRRDGYAVFPSVDAGWEALRQQIRLNVSRGLNLSEFFGGKPGVYKGYAPSAGWNDPERYAAYVSTRTGVPVDVPLSEYSEPAQGSSSFFREGLDLERAGSQSSNWVLAGALGLGALSLAVLLFS